MVHMDLDKRLEEIQSKEIGDLLGNEVEKREELVNLLLDGIQYYQRYQADVLTWLIQVMITNKLVKLTPWRQYFGQIDPLAPISWSN